MDIVWLLIKSSWVSMLVAVLAGVISGGASTGLIALINTAITTVIDQRDYQSLIFPFVGFALLALVTSSLSQFLLVNLAQDSVYRLRLQLSQQILSAPLQTLEQLGPSQLFAFLTKDVEAISNTAFAIPILCVNVAVIGGCLIYLGLLSGWVLLAVVLFLGLAIALIQVLMTSTYRYLALARQEIDGLFKHFRSITDGIKELKLHSARRQLFFEEDLQASAASSRRYTKMAFGMAALTTSSGKFLFFTLIGLLLFGLPQLLPVAQTVLPAYVLTMMYLLGPIESTIEMLPNLASANVSIQKVRKMGFTLTERAEIESVVRQPINGYWQTIELQQVIHRYQGESENHQFTVGPIDLTIKSGELIFIVGGNGSGKSTLAKLLTGLYTPVSGKLCLDDMPIVEANREWYRQNFSTVFSDFYLFERLVSTESLTLDEQAKMYLEKLQLEKKVSVQDGKLSTTALSQGQRKRLSLLSAYLENRPIYVFDEWAADQDPIFREIFYTQLLAELKKRGKTILVISHDDHYFHLADRIIKLDYGRIESDEYTVFQ